jgi:hypothetical protein
MGHEIELNILQVGETVQAETATGSLYIITRDPTSSVLTVSGPNLDASAFIREGVLARGFVMVIFFGSRESVTTSSVKHAWLNGSKVF